MHNIPKEYLKDPKLKGIFKEVIRSNKEEAKAHKIVDKMLACIPKKTKKNSFLLSVRLTEAIGEKLIKKFAYSDTVETISNNPFFDFGINSFVKHNICTHLKKNFDVLWEKQPKKIYYYGDMDNWFIRYKENDKVRVAVVDDSATMSDECKFLIVDDKKYRKMHVRILVESKKSDYPKKRYPQKLGINFYKARDFNLEFDDKAHMTNLGSVYGDARDKGYVLSFSYNNFSNVHDQPEGCLHVIGRINHIAMLLSHMSQELEMDEKEEA